MLSDSQGIEPEGIPEGYTVGQKIIIGVVVAFVAFCILLAALAWSFAVNSLPDDYAGRYCEQEMYLEEGEHYVCDMGSLQGNYKVSWTYDHKDGSSNVDVYVLDYTNYQRYGDEKSFVFIEELSRENIKSTTLDETTVKFNQDTYYFVVDHSTSGEAQPDSNDEVRIDVRINMGPT